jgi:arginine decarboxylase
LLPVWQQQTLKHLLLFGYLRAKPQQVRMLSQQVAPLVTALQHCANRPNAAFYTPGHKRGQGISDLHQKLLGKAVFRADLPELPELDNLFAPAGVIQQAQVLAAEAFGAEHTWFLANGSTCGIEAAILATCNPDDKILVPRNVHRSVISGLILAGAIPVLMPPVYAPHWRLAWGVRADAIARALSQYPDIRAVLIVSPTYQGICSDVTAIARIVHDHGIPLIVDEAHGPHFAFHPELPRLPYKPEPTSSFNRPTKFYPPSPRRPCFTVKAPGFITIASVRPCN